MKNCGLAVLTAWNLLVLNLQCTNVMYRMVTLLMTWSTCAQLHNLFAIAKQRIHIVMQLVFL